jgi:1,4-dihydroxy-2-naphthoate octaprenyltransferase
MRGKERCRMGWPQITMIVLYAISIGITLASKNKELVFFQVLGTVIQAAILYAGGFWDL